MRGPPGFRALTLTGTGATSRVFRAEDARTGHPVALKRLHRTLISSPEALARLKREFEALARLRHPALVAVRDVIRWEGDPTLVMDFIEGRDLDRVLAEDGPLAPEAAEALARTLFEALGTAHGAGIVHRDVKPQNVRVGPDGQVYLLDFGSARLDAASQLTETGTSVGTPDYMAPELFSGAAYDPRVDIYGVGATLFKALTGQPPQTAEALTELAYRRAREPAPLVRSLRADVPAALAQVVDRCLERAADQRFASCALALWALEHPRAERRFRQRRRAHPPCLHCGTPIPPASVVCARCGSDHPFSYAPGSHHVVIHNVRQPGAFVAAVQERFPERAHADHLTHLSQRIAAVGRESQRVVSFVDELEAQRLADALEDAGAQCEVEEDQGTTGWRLYGVSLALFMFAFVGLGRWALDLDLGMAHAALLVLPALGALGLERLLSVARGAQGILSSGRYPAAVLPGLRAGLGVSTGGLLGASVLAPVAGGALVTAGAGAAGAAVTALGLPLLVGGVMAAGATLVAWWASFSAPRLSRAASPEPGLGAKLVRAFSPPRALSTRRMRAETAVLVTASVLALVPAELAALDAMAGAVPSLAKVLAPAVQLPVAPALPAPLPGVPAAPGGMSPAPALPEPAPVSPGAPAPVAPVAPVASVPQPGLPLWSHLLALLMAVGGAGLITFILRRHRQVLEEGRRVEQALGGGLLEAPAEPVRRGAARLGAPDALAALPAPDPFTVAARTRAADLAHLLPAEGVDRLRRALEAVAQGSGRRDSALARTILESDPELRLRFDLLALEGELEARAATAWWEQIEATDGDPE
ncbi:MAG: serine/threonine protein kinase [Deltaproteobacteria bacterium]|nr:serine/threonine protein kinase [Deltaproteobacteria bacterium]